MQFRQALPALAVALAASAALGPPVAAAPGEGGGATAAPPGPQGGAGGGGGAAYGQPAPKPKRRPARRSTASGEHRFPIAGSFDWGGADARFGARRKGHRHQGQDLAAASGTPLVAPYRGVVTAVQYQAKGAGHYVVIRAEDYDYVFMHLRTGSIVVGEGDGVRTGQRIGEVGSSGGSSGPHLHFEIWVGGWYAGGHPIDPLPLLQAWSGLSPASG